MNANPAYYQVMYNEMVQKTSSQLAGGASGGNLYGADSRHLPTNAGLVKNRKPLGKAGTQSVSGQNPIQHYRAQ